MEKREDLRSILPYLPLAIQSSSLVWPAPRVVEVLEEMARELIHSGVGSGDALSDAIADMRQTLSLTAPLSPSALRGYALFFDERTSKEESTRWFNDIIPAMACLLLRFPSLLEEHYRTADGLIDETRAALCLLGPQEAGIVFLSQELVGALLVCSFFSLFPITERSSNHLPIINFDKLFGNLINSGQIDKQENKIRCIFHYFERICSCAPPCFVSFERKVLPLEHQPAYVTYPDAGFWSSSVAHLCPVEVQISGLIEDQCGEALEVDFANKYLGGGALRKGCVQIRFMINPELIAGMLFLPAMEANEAIEIVGAERFSHYTGYSSSLRFAGDYVDRRELDVCGRRKTRITAGDALRRPGMSQYKTECLIREINKALCGFLHCYKHQNEARLEAGSNNHPNFLSADVSLASGQCMDHEDRVGIATGNWGCRAYGGDPELKSMLQWLVASQTGRPFMSYYTFGLEALENLNKVKEWILSKEWAVGDLWNKLVKYSGQRLTRETKLGFFSWLVPTPSA